MSTLHIIPQALDASPYFAKALFTPGHRKILQLHIYRRSTNEHVCLIYFHQTKIPKFKLTKDDDEVFQFVISLCSRILQYQKDAWAYFWEHTKGQKYDYAAEVFLPWAAGLFLDELVEIILKGDCFALTKANTP